MRHLHQFATITASLLITLFGMVLLTSQPSSCAFLGEQVLDEIHATSPDTRHDSFKFCEDLLDLPSNHVSWFTCEHDMPPILPPNIKCVQCSADSSSHVGKEAKGPNRKFDGNIDCNDADKYIGDCVEIAGSRICFLEDTPEGSCEHIMERWGPQPET